MRPEAVCLRSSTTQGFPLPVGKVWSSAPPVTLPVTSTTESGTSAMEPVVAALHALAHCATSVLRRVDFAVLTTGSASRCTFFTAETERSPHVAVRSPSPVTTTFSAVGPVPTVMVSPGAMPPSFSTLRTSSPVFAMPHSLVVTDGGAVVVAGRAPVRLVPAGLNSRP